MPVGIERINDPNVNPNPNIIFIRSLDGKKDSDKALKILECVAAQFRSIMKSRGYGVNSLCEHEWNPIFSGRNWNGGEIIELVLRKKDGSFVPYRYILFVMCHELAHIEQMNHSHDFKKVDKSIRAELAALRANSYYGDGFYSSGRVLTRGLEEPEFRAEDYPVFTCGGTNKRKRTLGTRNSTTGLAVSTRKSRAGPSKPGRTGRQTIVGRVAGSRIKSTTAFAGNGHVLNDDPGSSTFRKKAGSSSAVEARAKAAEARMKESKKIKEKAARKEETKKWQVARNDIIDLCDESDEDDNDHGQHDFHQIKAEESDYEEDSDVEIIEQILDQEDLNLEVKSENDDGAYWEDERDAYLQDDMILVKGGETFTVGAREKDRSGSSSSYAEAGSSRSKGKKRAITPISESESSDIEVPSLKSGSKSQGKRQRASTDSDLDAEIQKSKKKSASKSKSNPKASGKASSNSNTSGRRWRADSEERKVPSSSSPKSKRRAPITFFKSKPELQEQLEDAKRASRRRIREDSSSEALDSPSPSASPPSTRTKKYSSAAPGSVKPRKKDTPIVILSSSEDDEDA